MPAAAKGRLRTNTVDKPWADAIRICVLEKKKGSPTNRLRTIADKTVSLAEEGDMEAIKEIGNRLDGKAKQQVDLGGDGLADLATAIMAARVRARGP